MKLAPWPRTPERLASVKSVLVKSEPNKVAPCRSALARSAPLKLEPKKAAPCRSEPTIDAPAKLAPMNLASGSLRPESSQLTHMPPNDSSRAVSSPSSAAQARVTATVAPRLAIHRANAMRDRKMAGERDKGDAILCDANKIG